MTEKTTDDIILNRNNWFKIIATGGLLGCLILKVLISPIIFDFSKFELMDILSLLLAFFAIGLS